MGVSRPDFYLIDPDTGEPIGVLVDGSIYRLETAARLFDGSDVALDSAEGGSAASVSALTIAGVGTDGNTRCPIMELDTNSNWRMAVATGDFVVAQDEVVHVDVYQTGIPGTLQYSLLVDLDNEGGAYPHDASLTGLELYSVSAEIVRSSTGGVWSAIAGVILDIDGTDATIAWLQFLSLYAQDTGMSVVERERQSYPVPLDVTVVSNALPKIGVSFIETVTAVNTGITLPDIEGVGRTPAIGDLIYRIEKTSGAGTATVHGDLAYRGVS